MAIVVRNTNYNGEVLEKILTLATTGNDLVEKGLIMVIPGVEKSGFGSVRTLLRSFKQSEGMTPSQWKDGH